MNKTGFVPNSFQTPNGYIDDIMPFLTGEEFKVLIYATRRILGFQKRQDRISISQFTEGTWSRGHDHLLDCGTGLSIETVKKSLSNLVEFNLMVRVAENDPRTNEGVLWGLQWDENKVNWQALREREEQRAKVNTERMVKARSMRQSHPTPQTPTNGIERTPANGTSPPPTSGIETQYPEENQGNTDINNKEAYLDFMQRLALSVFHSNIEGWRKMRRRLECDDIAIICPAPLPHVIDPSQPVSMKITGLSKKLNGSQFTEAAVFEDRYYRGFANLGLELEFTP